MQVEDGEMPRMLMKTKNVHTASSRVKLPTQVILTAPAKAEATFVQVKYAYGAKETSNTGDAGIKDVFTTAKIELTQPLTEDLDSGASLGPEFMCIIMPFKVSRKATVQFDFQMSGNSPSTFRLSVDNSAWVDVTIGDEDNGDDDWFTTQYEWRIEAGDHKLCVSACDIGAELTRVRGTDGVRMLRKSRHSEYS